MWATVEDVRARWPGAPANDAQIQAWLDDAETIIRAEYPLIDEWLAENPELLPVLKLVQTRMVVRGMAAPAGISREQVGDTSVAYQTGAGLGLTDADRALIDGFGTQRGFTVDTMPAREHWYYDGLWVNWNRPGGDDMHAIPLSSPPAESEFYSGGGL